MAVEEARRVALRQHVAATWGEEAAQTLFELVAPSGEDPATRQDLERFGDRVDERFAEVNGRFPWIDRRFDEVDHRFEEVDRRFDQVDHRFEEVDRRFDEVDHRFEVLDHRLESMEHRLVATFERGISAAVTTQTRTLVISQLAAIVAMAALAFGLVTLTP